MKTVQIFIETLDQVIESNYQNEGFGVKELASKMNMSRSKLYRKLLAACGISPSAYLNQYRLKKAYQLLQKGGMTTSEVAFHVGFSSASYFSTSFKKYFSYSPTQVQINVSKNVTELDTDETPQFYPKSETFIKKGFSLNLRSWIIIILLGIGGITSAAFFIFEDQTFAKDAASNEIGDKSIAVLPFQNFTKEEYMDAFCHGLTDELISKLAKIEEFDRVISRTTSFKFKNANLSIPEIAQQLGVSYILEGNIQKSDDKIRMNVQLIDVKTDDHVWTDQYLSDWESTDIFRIQDEITEFVVNAMKIALSISETNSFEQETVPNKQAYDLFLYAKYYTFNGDQESMEKGQSLLLKSMVLDSNFSRTYSELGFIWFTRGLSEGVKNQNLAWTQAKYFMNKAQELNPNLLNNNLNLLQGYFYYDWNFKKLEQFYKSEFLNHAYDRETIGIIDYATKTGRFQDALNSINKSIELDPLDPVLFSFKARVLYFMGKKREAVDVLEHMDQLNMDDWFYLRESTVNYFIMEEYEHSEKLLNIVMEQFQDRSPVLLWLKLFYACKAGDFILKNILLDELQTAYQNLDSGSPAWFIALFHLTINKDKNKAFEWLEKSFERKEVELTWLKLEPLLEPLKNDERYWTLYQKIGFNLIKDN